MRKSKELLQEKIKAKELLEEVMKNESLALQEESNILDEATEAIENICSDNGLFCGVILTTDVLLSIMKLAIEKKENISIPFRVYYTD